MLHIDCYLQKVKWQRNNLRVDIVVVLNILGWKAKNNGNLCLRIYNQSIIT